MAGTLASIGRSSHRRSVAHGRAAASGAAYINADSPRRRAPPTTPFHREASGLEHRCHPLGVDVNWFAGCLDHFSSCWIASKRPEATERLVASITRI